MNNINSSRFRAINVICIPLMFVCFLWSGVRVILADTHYVSLAGTNDAPYTNGWASAATNIQWAITAATVNDTVLVSNGTYNLTNQISIGINITVRSLNGRNVTVVNGNYPDYSNGCFSMSAGVLDGFTISNGYGGSGGGVNFSGGTITNCIIKNNTATNYGGGLNVSGGVIQDCVISNNQSLGGRGGGVYFPGLTGNVVNCVICNNSSVGGGGGVYYNYASAVIRNSTIRNNIAPNGYGGGAYFAWGTAQLRNSVVSGNTSSNTGGGIHIQGGADPVVANCLIINNASTNSSGGGVYLRRGGQIKNCTISSNTASLGSGGGIYTESFTDGTGTVQNTIIYFNRASVSAYDNYRNGGVCHYSNCCFYPALSDGSTNLSSNNITNDPRMVDLNGGNYRLGSGSPCINRGINQDWMMNAVDLDNRPRIRDGTVDIGCYEYIFPGTVFTIR